jgi:hypothetical protein
MSPNYDFRGMFEFEPRKLVVTSRRATLSFIIRYRTQPIGLPLFRVHNFQELADPTVKYDDKFLPEI